MKYEALIAELDGPVVTTHYAMTEAEDRETAEAIFGTYVCEEEYVLRILPWPLRTEKAA